MNNFDVDVDKKYLLAVSGGADSMAMLDMFYKHSPKLQFFVVTVDHQLRNESSSDCQFVAQWCGERGIDCHVVTVDVKGYCEEHGVSVETGARILRHNALKQFDCDYICLAHNKDDNAESILMHIVRGSGVKGALGMQPYSGRYFRPLINMSKDEVLTYCRLNNVRFVVDETNNSVDYTRNFVRHNIMPLLRQVNSAATDNIVQFGANLSADQQFLLDVASIDDVVFGNGYAFIPSRLLKQHPAIAYRVVDNTLQNMGYCCDFRRCHYNDIVALADKQSGSRVDLPHGLVAYNDYNGVTLSIRQEGCNYSMPFQTGTIQLPNGTLYIGSEHTEDSLRVDIDKIPTDAVIRTPMDGDTFTKFGGGTKPLNRYLTDKKIPARLRSSIPLIASGNNVLVVCGVEISQSVKTDGQSKIYYINFTKGEN